MYVCMNILSMLVCEVKSAFFIMIHVQQEVNDLELIMSQWR